MPISELQRLKNLEEEAEQVDEKLSAARKDYEMKIGTRLVKKLGLDETAALVEMITKTPKRSMPSSLSGELAKLLKSEMTPPIHAGNLANGKSAMDEEKATVAS